MKSVILYDIRNDEIKFSQPKAMGSAPLPDLDTVCASAKIPNEEKQYMQTCLINTRMLKNDAFKKLRIVNSEAILKPKLNITTDKQQVDISTDPEFTVTVNITDTIDSDDFTAVNMLINDAEFSIDISNNQGNKVIELSVSDTYVIKCNDDRFRSNRVEVEGV